MFPINHTSVRSFWTKSLGRALRDSAPHSLVKDCRNWRSRFSLRMADFDNSFSMSKAAICSRLSIDLEARSIKKGEHWNENVLKKNSPSCGITELKSVSNNVLPVHTASVSVIASKMSADGFNSPSLSILVLSSCKLLHCGYTKIIIFKKEINNVYWEKLKSTLRNFLCWMTVLCKTVNPHFKSDANQTSDKTKITVWRSGRRMWYDDKILF